MMRSALVGVLFLSGCASFSPDGTQSAGGGQAVYHYKKTADTCEVTITSGRELSDVSAGVDKNCAVDFGAKALTGQEMQMDMLGIISTLVKP
jgi:hypothetical protein